MSTFFLLLRVHAAAQNNALQNSVPHAGAPPRADARKLLPFCTATPAAAPGLRMSTAP